MEDAIRQINEKLAQGYEIKRFEGVKDALSFTLSPSESVPSAESPVTFTFTGIDSVEVGEG